MKIRDWVAVITLVFMVSGSALFFFSDWRLIKYQVGELTDSVAAINVRLNMIVAEHKHHQQTMDNEQFLDAGRRSLEHTK